MVDGSRSDLEVRVIFPRSEVLNGGSESYAVRKAVVDDRLAPYLRGGAASDNGVRAGVR